MEKLLIADSSSAFLRGLEAELAGQFQIRSCMDGETAQALLESFQPDVLIINLMLPYLDGLTVLQHAAFHPSVIIALTPYMNQYIHTALWELGVDYTMICPSVKALCLQLRNLVEVMPSLSDNTPQEFLPLLLGNLGFAPHWDGYRQLCAAIPLFSANPGQLLTKELYPQTARVCKCGSGKCVEHSIRKAIRTAWEHGDRSTWRKYFTPGPRGQIPCPTNKEFICRMAELLSSK